MHLSNIFPEKGKRRRVWTIDQDEFADAWSLDCISSSASCAICDMPEMSATNSSNVQLLQFLRFPASPRLLTEKLSQMPEQNTSIGQVLSRMRAETTSVTPKKSHSCFLTRSLQSPLASRILSIQGLLH